MEDNNDNVVIYRHTSKQSSVGILGEQNNLHERFSFLTKMNEKLNNRTSSINEIGNKPDQIEVKSSFDRPAEPSSLCHIVKQRPRPARTNVKRAKWHSIKDSNDIVIDHSTNIIVGSDQPTSSSFELNRNIISTDITQQPSPTPIDKQSCADPIIPLVVETNDKIVFRSLPTKSFQLATEMSPKVNITHFNRSMPNYRHSIIGNVSITENEHPTTYGQQKSTTLNVVQMKIDENLIVVKPSVPPKPLKSPPTTTDKWMPQLKVQTNNYHRPTIDIANIAENEEEESRPKSFAELKNLFSSKIK